MSAERQTPPRSGDSSLSWQIMHISYKIGYLQRTCDLILAAVQTARPTAPTMSTARRSGRMKDRFARVTIHLRLEDLRRLYRAWREGPWGLLGLALWGLAKFFGLL